MLITQEMRAEKLARDVFGDDMQGQHLTIDHISRVAKAGKTHFDRTVGWLHDLVEDTTWSIEDLRKEKFSEDVLLAVDAVTRKEGETYTEFIDRIATVPFAIPIKLNDLRDNLARCHELPQERAERLTQQYTPAIEKLENCLQALPPPSPIKEYRGENFFLSNFSRSSFVLDGITYPTAEHAFAAYKVEDLNIRRAIAALSTPGEARKVGRSWMAIAPLDEHGNTIGPAQKIVLRKDWENVKDDIMFEIVMAKFTQNPELKEKLLLTGTTDLAEGTSKATTGHVDMTWGKNLDTGEGQNRLGKIHMEVRGMLWTQEWYLANNQKKSSFTPSKETVMFPKHEKQLTYLHHTFGTVDASKDLSFVGDALRNLDSKACGVTDPDRYQSKEYVTIVGSRETSPEEEAYLAWVGETIAEAGIQYSNKDGKKMFLEQQAVLRSGAAKGADLAAESGVHRAIKKLFADPKEQEKATRASLEISHPYPRPTLGSNNPGNYVLTHKPYKDICLHLVENLTDNYDRMSDAGKALQARDIAQDYGKDGKTPSKAIIYCSSEYRKLVAGGTRFAVYAARLSESLGFERIPEFNIRDGQEREACTAWVVDFANNLRFQNGQPPLAETEQKVPVDLQSSIARLKNSINDEFGLLDPERLELVADANPIKMKHFKTDGSVAAFVNNDGQYVLLNTQSVAIEEGQNQEYLLSKNANKRVTCVLAERQNDLSGR